MKRLGCFSLNEEVKDLKLDFLKIPGRVQTARGKKKKKNLPA
jgi:hypothetical protein